MSRTAIRILSACIIIAKSLLGSSSLANDKSSLQSSQLEHLTSDQPKQESNFKKILQYPFSFFDGAKIQLTYSQPKLTHVNHQIDMINNLLNTNLRDWDSKNIFTVDLVLWKELLKYFKVDFAVVLSSGALKTSDTAFRNTLHFNTRFRQKYDILMLWSNFYYYPLTYNIKEHKPDRLFDPFFGGGLGYTFLREETSVKLSKGGFYNKVLSNYNDKEIGYKVLGGFDMNLGKLSNRLENWGLTFTVLKIWNRMKGHANVHLTEDLRGIKPIDIDLRYKERMDIDLTGMNYSIAISYKF